MLQILTCILPTGLPKVRFLCGVTTVVRLERWVFKGPAGTHLTRQQLPLKLAWAISIHKSQVSVSSHGIQCKQQVQQQWSTISKNKTF